MNNETYSFPAVHHGRNIKRLREILGVKQEVIAAEFEVSQQAVSEWEGRAQLGDDVLTRVAKILNIPVDAIKNFNEEKAVNIIANTFNDGFHDNASFISYQPTFNQVDKLLDLMERLLNAQQEKNALLEKILAEKSF